MPSASVVAALSPPSSDDLPVCLRPPPVLSASPAASTPESFANGRYAVKRFLGEGGKKRVYLVHDTLLDRDVAFSLIKTEGWTRSASSASCARRRLMGRLGGHPHIVTLFDIGEEDGQPYLVSELMGGGDVEGLIEKAPEHRLPLEDTLRIADEVCQALEYAHGHGIVHRDLKPGNVWLTQEGTAKLGDFGLAVAIDKTRLTVAGMIVGTVAYMPPGAGLGQDSRCPLRPLLARRDALRDGHRPAALPGRRPGRDHQPARQHAAGRPLLAHPALPKPLEALILRLLEKDPAQRPPSAAAVREELAAIQRQRSPRPAASSVAPEELANPLDRLAGGVFVGRERELETLRAALDGALSGRGQVVLLAGEPGIGKTRLAEELATYAALRGLPGALGPLLRVGGRARPTGPGCKSLRAYVHDRDPQQLRSELGSGAAEIAQVVSEIRERLPELPDPAAGRAGSSPLPPLRRRCHLPQERLDPPTADPRAR